MTENERKLYRKISLKNYKEKVKKVNCMIKDLKLVTPEKICMEIFFCLFINSLCLPIFNDIALHIKDTFLFMWLLATL